MRKLLCFVVIWLVKQVVCCKFFVLITGEISLDDCISWETKSAQLAENVNDLNQKGPFNDGDLLSQLHPVPPL